MKGLTPVIAMIVLLLITVAMAFFFLSFLMESYSVYTSKTITTSFDFDSCNGRAASITIRNAGTDSIQAASPPDSDFGKLGNMVPNAGFEDDANGNGKPDLWEGQQSEEQAAVILATDLSNSMSDCMDSRQTMPDNGTVLLNHFDDGTASDSSAWRNHGRLGNTAGADPGDPAQVTGRLGNALKFDGF